MWRCFPRFGILTPEEMHARYEIHLENYCKVTAIEAATLRDMTLRGILPAVTRYTGDLAKGVVRKRQAEMATSCRVESYLVAQLDALSGDLLDACQAMSRALEAAPAADAGIDAARYYRDQVASRLEEMRASSTAWSRWWGGRLLALSHLCRHPVLRVMIPDTKESVFRTEHTLFSSTGGVSQTAE